MKKTAMLRSFFAVPLFALTFFALEPREALAMPTAQLSDVVSSPVEKTWGGCGPYGHRGPWGGCRRGGAHLGRSRCRRGACRPHRSHSHSGVVVRLAVRRVGLRTMQGKKKR